MVHTHDERPHIYGAFAARLAGVRRLIHTRHHGMAYRLIAAAGGPGPRWRRELTDRFVCVSADSARQAVRQGVSAADGARPLQRHRPDAVRRRPPSARAGRWSRSPASARKRTSVLCFTRRRWRRREDDAFRLEIAGDGPCMADLRRTAAELGLGGACTFHGQVRDVPALLARAGLFVLPSLTEGVSLTLLEAMACGLAVVATRVGGNPEVVADGETGLLVAARRPGGAGRGDAPPAPRRPRTRAAWDGPAAAASNAASTCAA